MITAISIVFICLYAVLDGLGDAFIFRDQVLFLNNGERISDWWYRRTAKHIAQSADMNTNWHRAQAAQQSAVILVTAYLSGCWQLIPLGAGLFWLIHDGIVNRIGLDRPFFFVGTTAWIDRQFQKLSDPELAMAVAKAGLLVAGIVLLFIK